MEDLLADMFAAGAYSAALDAGMEKDAADRFVLDVCKESAARNFRYDDEEEEGTWWERNKSWAFPSAVGLLAFLAGSDAGKNGRPDRSPFSNAMHLAYKRIKALFGIPDDPMYNASTIAIPRTDWRKYEIGMINNEKDIRELEDALSGNDNTPSYLNPNKHPDGTYVQDSSDVLKNVRLRPFTSPGHSLLEGYGASSSGDYKGNKGYNPISWAR